MFLEKIKGFTKLKKEHQLLFLRVYTAHQGAINDTEKWQPIAVKWQKNFLEVKFGNGRSAKYEPFCKWSQCQEGLVC